MQDDSSEAPLRGVRRELAADSVVTKLMSLIREAAQVLDSPTTYLEQQRILLLIRKPALLKAL